MKAIKKDIEVRTWQVPEEINFDELPKWVKKAKVDGKIEIKEEQGLIPLNSSYFEKIPKYPAVFINNKNGTIVVEQGNYLVKKQKFFGYEIIGMEDRNSNESN